MAAQQRLEADTDLAALDPRSVSLVRCVDGKGRHVKPKHNFVWSAFAITVGVHLLCRQQRLAADETSLRSASQLKPDTLGRPERQSLLTHATSEY